MAARNIFVAIFFRVSGRGGEGKEETDRVDKRLIYANFVPTYNSANLIIVRISLWCKSNCVKKRPILM